MAGTIKDSFLDLERHRQLLEENIEKLRISLRHWQTWEAEYEGLKEEILAADPLPNRAQLIILGHEYEAELVNRKEIVEILGPESRGVTQVVNILDRRLDYVEQNVKTIQKQVEVAENKLAAATIISTPDVRNEEGLPLTEIVEELDEEGNVISSHTTTPGSAKPQLLEVLKKAGVKDIPTSDVASSSKPPTIQEEEQGETLEMQAESKQEKPAKKGVKFTEDTKPGPEQEISRTAKRIGEIMKMAKQSEEKPSDPPTIPKDESPEDAELRNQMLLYEMSEVGAVVAELQLEEGSDWSDGAYEDDTSSDDEDSFGRSTGCVVDDDLRQRMIEIEQRLGARFMENIGYKASDPEIVREGIGRVTISGLEDNVSGDKAEVKSNGPASAPSSSSKKVVRFSEDLDISPAPQPSLDTRSSPDSGKPPVSDIVERTAPDGASLPTPKKASKFRSDRGGSPAVLNGPLATTIGRPSLSLRPLKSSKPKPFSQPIEFPRPEAGHAPTAPTGPEGRTLATTVVERDVPLDTVVAEPDELDQQLLHQEVATEYHRLRNRMIQRQGGFMKEEESEIVPFSEEEGGPKKMSRFKAARLAKS